MATGSTKPKTTTKMEFVGPGQKKIRYLYTVGEFFIRYIRAQLATQKLPFSANFFFQTSGRR